MAYCKNCGAYIPDGQTKCLACGISESPAEKEQAAQASQYQQSGRIDHSYLRKELEEQRKRQQENSRKWAEAEFAQRQQAQEKEAQQYVNRGNSSNVKSNNYSNLNKSTILAAMSYFSALFIVPYLCANDDRFAIYHAKQGMILFIAGILAEVVASIFGLKWIVNIARIYFIYKGVYNVFSNRMEPLPLIGNLLK